MIQGRFVAVQRVDPSEARIGMIILRGRVGFSGTERERLSGDSRSPGLTRTNPRKVMIVRW
jgi:hypothetical protein